MGDEKPKFRNLKERLRQAGQDLMQVPEMPDQDQMMADPIAAKDAMGGQGLVNVFNAFNTLQPTPEEGGGVKIGQNPVTGEDTYMGFGGAIGGITKLNKAPRLFKAGGTTFPAAHAAEGMTIQNALERTGNVSKGLPLQATGEVTDIGKVIMADSLKKPNPINNINYEEIFKKLNDHYSAVEDLKRANPNFDKSKALLERTKARKK